LAEKYEKADKELLDNPGIQRYETFFESSDGIRRNIIFNKATFTNQEGKVAGLIGVIVDITESKRVEKQVLSALQEKEVLLREIHHRVKNNLQVIQSLLSLQAGKIKDPEAQEAFKESGDRVRSMALVHEKLYQSADLCYIDMVDYLSKLGPRLFQASQISLEKVKLKLDVETIRVGIDRAIPLGLILNELITNALKHAFSDGREGQIRVWLAQDEGMIRLTVGNNGVGFPETVNFRKSESMGFQIITALVEQLGGTIELNREGGTEFKITFPEGKT
jgi:two-component sensor histidine kinase